LSPNASIIKEKYWLLFGEKWGRPDRVMSYQKNNCDDISRSRQEKLIFEKIFCLAGWKPNKGELFPLFPQKITLFQAQLVVWLSRLFCMVAGFCNTNGFGTFLALRVLKLTPKTSRILNFGIIENFIIWLKTEFLKILLKCPQCGQFVKNVLYPIVNELELQQYSYF
jgi:hypothetical protein